MDAVTVLFPSRSVPIQNKSFHSGTLLLRFSEKCSTFFGEMYQLFRGTVSRFSENCNQGNCKKPDFTTVCRVCHTPNNIIFQYYITAGSSCLPYSHSHKKWITVLERKNGQWRHQLHWYHQFFFHSRKSTSNRSARQFSSFLLLKKIRYMEYI